MMDPMKAMGAGIGLGLILMLPASLLFERVGIPPENAIGVLLGCWIGGYVVAAMILITDAPDDDEDDDDELERRTPRRHVRPPPALIVDSASWTGRAERGGR